MSRPRSLTPGPVGARHPVKPSPWGTYNRKGSASDPQTYTSYSSLFGAKFQESQSKCHRTQRGRSPQNPWVARKVQPGLCGPDVTLWAFSVHSYSLYVSTPSGRLQKGRSQLVDSHHDPLLKVFCVPGPVTGMWHHQRLLAGSWPCKEAGSLP